MQDRRYPYRSFKLEYLSSFLKCLGKPVTVHDYELCTTGRSNTNYKVILSDGSCYLLRLYAHSRPERDAYVLDLVKDIVPVPDLLAQGPQWAIFSFLPGQLLADRLDAVNQAATVLAQLATIQFPVPGQLQTDGSITPFDFGGLSGYIAQRLAHPAVQHWLRPETLNHLQQFQHQAASLLQELDTEACLVHGDFNPTNILIQDNQVSGVLDWDYCHSGTPYMDIGNLLRHTPIHQHPQIKVGLEQGGMALPTDWQRRAELVDLTSQLEFLTASRSDSFKQQCVHRIKQYIGL